MIKAVINGRGDDLENVSKEFDHEDISHLPSLPTSAAPNRFDDTGV
jgi:hypothetical protein